MTKDEIREYARAGALEHAKRLITEFPEILNELRGFAERLRLEDLARSGSAPLLEAALEAPGALETAVKRRRMTEAGRRAIADAQHRRWAKRRAGQKGR